MARLLGAGRIVATGRGDDQLREVEAIGADTGYQVTGRWQVVDI